MGDFYFNYSIVTADLVTEYSQEALADADFVSTDSDARVVITGLKSHDWYTQNPTMEKIDKDALSRAGKDDLFVIGRNVYQVACGEGRNAVQFLGNLKYYLGLLLSEQSFHLLNGMLYEVYFDHRGRKREQGKCDKIDDLFVLEGDSAYANSFDFIRQALKPYMKELFYVPGSLKHVRSDITTTEREGHRAISGVYFEGDNVLYNEKGQYFDPVTDDFLKTATNKQFKETLRDGMAVPTYRLDVNYVDVSSTPEVILIPFYPKILRYSKYAGPPVAAVPG
jgi:hypothetical protein